MSYSEPRQGRSPLFFIGIGCLVLFGLGFVGCIAIGAIGVNMFKGVADAADKPIPKEQVIAGLKDIPVYPNAPLVDVPTTRMMRAGMMLMTKTGAIKQVEVGTFGPKDPYEKIRAFYDAKLKAAGYTAVKASENIENDSKQWSYRKGDTVALFSYQKLTKDEQSTIKSDTPEQSLPTYEGPLLTIFRMDGVKEGTDINGLTKGRVRPSSSNTNE